MRDHEALFCFGRLRGADAPGGTSDFAAPRSGITSFRRQNSRLEQKAGDARADQRCDDEQPNLSERMRIGSRANDGRTKRAGGIDRGASDIDTEQMDGDERQTDRQPGKSNRRVWCGHEEAIQLQQSDLLSPEWYV